MAERRVYSVSEVTFRVKSLLEGELRDVSVQGEISNFRPAASGHLYFSLKDDDALLQAVMFRNRLPGLTFQPADGQLVVARGNISVYEKRGVYQVICETLTRAGQGAILAMLEERKRMLAAEGLFDESRKKPLPLLPRKIAVITSPTGSVIRDILRVTHRRNPGLDIVILPAPVQGEGAAQALAAQLRTADRFRLGEAIILARGGGSLEDLLPFYDEALVRAVAAAETPVISAVGHETDFSFCDLAADVRAPTPSAAAELVSAAREDLLYRVREYRLSIERNMTTRTERVRLLLSQFRPENIQRNLRSYTERYTLLLSDARQAVIDAIADTITRIRHRIELAKTEVSSRSPAETLKRGYAVVRRRSTGEVVRDAAGVKPDELLDVRLSRGSLVTEVIESHGEDKEL